MDPQQSQVAITPDTVPITPDPPPMATISADHGSMPPASPGLQYSRGYGGTGDDQRKFSGGFIDRSTSYLGQNLRSAGQALLHPLDTISSMLSSKTPPVDAAIQRYSNDPAALAGDVETAALTKTVGGKPPGINMAEAGASTSVPEGLAHPLQAIKNRSLGGNIRIADRPAPAWQTNPQPVTELPSMLDRPGPVEAPAGQQIVQKISDIGQQPTPRGPRPAPQWQQQNIQPTGTGFDWQGSTPEEVQAQLQRMSNRPRTSRPEGVPVDPSPYQVQNVPVQGVKPPAVQGTIPNLPEMQPSQSTTIAQHGYDPVKQQMTVQFKNGNVYRYSGVPQKVFDQYTASESQGSFHAQQIKGRYQTDLIGKVKPTPGQKVSQALGGQQ